MPQFRRALPHISELSRRQFINVTSVAGATAALTSSGSSAAPSSPFPSSLTTVDAEGNNDSAHGGRVAIAALSRPGSLDPGLAVDTETERISRQIFETLVSIDQETGSLTPQLAEDWDVSDDGLRYTFLLRSGVNFHDGSDLTADVVVANIRRWGRLNEIYGIDSLSRSAPLAFPSVFGGFSDQDSCVLDAVEADGEDIVVLKLTEPVVFLLQALTLPAFGIASQEVLSDDEPDIVDRSPIGTGPFIYTSLENGDDDQDRTLLRKNAEYWGEANGVTEVEVRPLPKSFDRLRELNRGNVDVYDGITAENLQPLVQSGRLLLQRDPFSILYLGFNLEHPVMSEIAIREAAAMAINRSALVESHFLDGTSPAHEFTPAALGVHSDATRSYPHDLDQARQLLEDSDYDGEPLPFYYPIHATRSYLPRPEAVFAAIAADLTAAGFTIEPRPIPWDSGYVDELLDEDDRAMHLLGRNGGYRSAHTFLAPLFAQDSREFHYRNDDVVDLLNAARAERNSEDRADLYREAAELISNDLPALPLAFPISGLALGPRVSDYPMSPVLNEPFEQIELTEAPE